MIDQHREAFKTEARELLIELENALLELEDNSGNMELIGKIFRALHTIKGSGGMFGFDDIAMFTHNVENLFDLIRNGEISVTKEMIDCTLAAKDQIALMLEESFTDESKTKQLIESFSRLVGKGDENKTGAAGIMQTDSAGRDIQSWFIHFNPSKDLFLSGTNPLLLIRELQGLGDCLVTALTGKIPPLEDLNPEDCLTAWNIILNTAAGKDAIRDVFIFVEDRSEIVVEVLPAKIDFSDHGLLSGIEDILRSKDNSLPQLQELLRETGVPLHSNRPAAAGNEQKRNNKTASVEAGANNDKVTSIRVSSDKLDKLVNLVGELVTVQARLSQFTAAHGLPGLSAIAEEVERLTWELRDSALNIRMLPIGTTFSRFKRLVRDLSNELGKHVELKTDGAETELDKTVIERLNDPLVHIIRNSIDHGIESPSERLEHGKPSTGTIHLSAKQSGGNVVIMIKDDGAGINKESVRAKAIANGLISAEAELKDSEIYSLIFAPGFSTASEVTNISGRGVGMDVVKKALEELRGSVEVASTPGEGTTISLKLPLTLAIIEGLLIEVGVDNFIIPLNMVEECIELTRETRKKSNNRNLVNVRGELVPYIPLREKFTITGSVPEIEQIVIVNEDGVRTGFVVDRVIGEHQTVLKSLGRYYRSVEGISGATVMGDGSVALILDIPKLVQMAETEEYNKVTFGKN